MNLYLLTHSAKGNRFHPDIFTFGGILQGQRIGYVRVSSFDQNPDRQLEQIEVGKVFTDKASGKDTQRPELERLLAFVREHEQQTLLCVFNFSDRATELSLPAEWAQASVMSESGTQGVRVEVQRLRFAPWGCAFLRPATGR